jgi:hypothetical protein
MGAATWLQKRLRILSALPPSRHFNRSDAFKQGTDQPSGVIRMEVEKDRET